MEIGLTKNQIVQELVRSSHGNLDAYVPIGREAAKREAEFLAHLIAWNELNGQIRDSKVALPVISLLANDQPKEFIENALAHIALLDPKNFLRAADFALDLKKKHGTTYHYSGIWKGLVERYLRVREQKWTWWEATAMQHRQSMRSLYAAFHIKPNAMADLILFNGQPPTGTVFAEIANLKNMSPHEAAVTITNRKIPFLVAEKALGAKSQDTDVRLAIINSMSPTELVANTKIMEKRGWLQIPALRGAYDIAASKATASKKSTFKATRAAAAVKDAGLKAKLGALQEKQIRTLGGVDGSWLVLADKSQSMKMSIEVARVVAGTLAKMVKGSVHLVFFDTTPRLFDVTGMTYEEILKETKHVLASGGTSIGVGLGLILSRNINVDGIAIVSDAQENTAPTFVDRYQRYVKVFDKEPTIYLYRTEVGVHGGSDIDLARSMKNAGLEMEEFDLRGKEVDYYSLANVVQTMRTQKYSLIDSIMEVPLLTLDEAFKSRARIE